MAIFNDKYLVLAGHVPYVLIGAGTASFAAAKAIREADPQAKVISLSNLLWGVVS